MRTRVYGKRAVGMVAAVAGLVCVCTSAADGAESSSVASGSLVRLAGHLPAWASCAPDLGALAADEPVTRITAVLARSPDRQKAWDDLLVAQQTPGSPDYHRWLSPEEIADGFGGSPSDTAAVQGWLEGHRLHVDGVSRSRGWITFSGTAASVGEALSTEFHRFHVGAETRISAASDPAIPASLSGAIRFFAGLSTVSPRAQGHARPGNVPPSPEYTSGSKHYIAPGDFAAIYDLASVYAEGFDGTGETIAIAGRSRVVDSDITEFQQATGLPAVAPTVVIPPSGIDPGLSGDGDELEATIDVTRAGSVASGATIDLVVSGTPNGSMLDGLAIAIEYAVDNDTAPVLSISFYECEQTGGPTYTQLYDTLFQQAAAEGMSVFVCAGDSGAAGCDDDGSTPPASQVASANYICASGSATCVGGTEFADTATPAKYWSGTNTSALASATGYIPEGAWNEPLDSANNPQIWEGGGGVSAYITKPSWQSGPGVPADGFRDTPDIAFSSSEHDGYYACYAADPDGNCANGSFEYFFGTSAAAPSMAGIAAIANQRTGKAQGNLNPLLYSLAGGASASTVFHDVTVATSGVTSCTDLPSMCNNSTPGPAGLSGGLAGYAVGTGFDLATGWGSLDVAGFLATFGCEGEPDGTACDDESACTKVDACKGGVCVGGSPVVCTAMDSCHSAGTCEPTTGTCPNPAKPDGASCNDGKACTESDTCKAGVCNGVATACMPEDACHSAGTCDPSTGACSNPPKSDGTACEGGSCTAGACVPAMGGGTDGGKGSDGGTETDASADGESSPGAGHSSGCGCRVDGGHGDGAPTFAIGVLALLGLFTRRSSSRSRA
jgi:pseudomonalisin